MFCQSPGTLPLAMLTIAPNIEIGLNRFSLRCQQKSLQTAAQWQSLVGIEQSSRSGHSNKWSEIIKNKDFFSKLYLIQRLVREQILKHINYGILCPVYHKCSAYVILT